MEEILEEGLEKGEQRANRRTAQDMLMDGRFTLEDVSRFSRLPLDEVKQLEKEISK